MDTTLYDLAEEIRLAAIDGLDPDREPDRSYVSTGVPAHDIRWTPNGPSGCDSILAVHVRGIRNLSEGQPTEICAFRPAVDMTITLVRCATAWTANGGIPQASLLAQESSDLMSDLWQVFTHLAQLWSQGTLFFCQEECRQVRFGRMVPSGPLGGAAAWVLDLTIIDPYTCEEGS